GTIIIGGDFNTCLDPHSDSIGYTGDFSGWTASNADLIHLLDIYDLHDAWRTLNPEGRAYTWSRSQASAQKSRLDRIYIPRALQPHLAGAEIHHTPTSISDHCITNITIGCTSDI